MKIEVYKKYILSKNVINEKLLPIFKLTTKDALLLVWLDWGSFELETLQRYSPRSDNTTSDISNKPDGKIFILWSMVSSWSSFSQRVSTLAENEGAVAVPDDKDEVEVTLHSKAAI